MKLLLSFPLIFLTACLLGQSTQVNEILRNAPRDTIERYKMTDREFDQKAIQVPYSSKQLLNFKPAEFEGVKIEEVALVYTDYPRGNARLQTYLNKMRILELARYFPEILDLPLESWRIVNQTDCPSKAAAKKLFHGFVLRLSPKLEGTDFTNEEKLAELTEGDTTIYNVLDRNKDWEKMLVVTDLTGSMSPYTAQLLVWFKLNEKVNEVEHFVFFNDGDDKSDLDKKIGETGGIYDGKAENFDEIAALATRTTTNGYGGDDPENNVEALLYGLKACQECKDVVMIADNIAAPRDVGLISKVDKPVKIILCGTEDGINTTYLDLAYQTGGSVHTIEEDIEDLIKVNEGEELRIGREVFTIRDGKFELLRRI